jgi:hypothetical protein
MSQESTSKGKLKITPKKILAILIILAIPILYYALTKYALPITTWNYGGKVVGFRTDLRAAQKIPIIEIESIPNVNDADQSIRDTLIRRDVQNITFLFEPTDDKNNALYVIEETELIKALTLSYLSIMPTELQPTMPNFNAAVVDNYTGITATQLNPKIVLIHPNFGNQTVVRQDGYIIYVEAKNTGNFDSNKLQFDLATERLMMALLTIKIQ